VTAATQEQSRAGAEVARRVEQNVQETAATAAAATQISTTTQEISRTAAELARVADNLRAQVERFSLQSKLAQRPVQVGNQVLRVLQPQVKLKA